MLIPILERMSTVPQIRVLTVGSLRVRNCVNPDRFGGLAYIFVKMLAGPQDAVVSGLGSGKSYTKVAEMIPSPLGPLSTQTLKRWYVRGSRQIQDITTRFAALVLSAQPDALIPIIPHSVRDRTVCFFYVLGEQWHTASHSGTSAAWNTLRTMVCLFSPSVSVNRVSYGLAPGHFP